MPKTDNKRNRSPAMQARANLLATMGARGNAASNIWLAHSFRGHGTRVLTSDASFMHFVLLEFDPDVLRFEAQPDEIGVPVVDQLHQVTFDALVDFIDGHRECRDLRAAFDEIDGAALLQREIKTGAARRLGASWVRISIEDLQKRRHAFWNGIRMLRCMTAAQGYAQEQFRDSLVRRLTYSGELTLGELLTAFDPSDRPLAESALYHLLSERYVAIDLEHGPVMLSTLVRWL